MDVRTSLNHELKVSKNIAKLFQNEAFNDVTIVLNNGELKANKVILCATSKFFYKAFHIKTESEASSVKVKMVMVKIRKSEISIYECSIILS